jgi:hypothetical protein
VIVRLCCDPSNADRSKSRRLGQDNWEIDRNADTKQIQFRYAGIAAPYGFKTADMAPANAIIAQAIWWAGRYCSRGPDSWPCKKKKNVIRW